MSASVPRDFVDTKADIERGKAHGLALTDWMGGALDRFVRQRVHGHGMSACQLRYAANVVRVMMRAENRGETKAGALEERQPRCGVTRVDRDDVGAGVVSDHPNVVVLKSSGV